MLEKSLKVLNDILVDFEKRYNYYDSINSNSDLKEIEVEINIMLKVVFSENTKLLLFEQLINDFHKDNNPALYNFYVHESRDLLRKYSFKNFIYGSWLRVLDNSDDRDLNLAEGYCADYSPLIYKISKFQNKISGLSTYIDLKAIYLEILQWYANDIDMLAYSSFKIRNPKIDEYDGFTPYDGSDEYTKKWFEDEITLDLWRKYPSTGFLSNLEYFYPEHYIKIANQNQLKLFNEALDLELNSLKKNILSSSGLIQIINIKRQLNLIENFVSGNFSELDYQRLSQIISFDRPNEVVIAYDDIIRFDVYDYHKILPYDGVNLRKSPRFVAEILIRYQNFLTEKLLIINKEKDQNSISKSKEKKPTPNNFGFIITKSHKLLAVFHQLQHKFDILDNSDNKISDLVNLLTAMDYSTIPYVIKIQCKTNVFCYILRESKFLFKNLNASTIGNSKKFYSNIGSVLTATNFNKSANSLSPNIKEEINKILQDLKK